MSRSFLDAFRSRRVWLLVALGFSSGLPLALTGATLAAWMTNVGVNLKTIGIFALAGLPYSLKFLWAPLLDRYSPGILGRRRGWIALSQVGLIAAIAGMGFVDPLAAPMQMAALAVVVAFLSATQDVVIDAWRTDVLPEHERGSGTATFVMGYRIGMLVSGALALMLSDAMPWPSVYFCMSAVMGIGLVATFLSPEPEGFTAPRSLGEAVVRPFVDWFSRDGAVLALAFLVLYKIGDALAGGMVTPFLIQLGFSNAEIGALNKGLGMVATIAGALVGGGLVSRLGIRRALFLFGILQAGTNVTYMLLAFTGKSVPMLVVAMISDNVTGGLGTSAFIAFLMSLCNRRYSATQYALLSSLSSVGGRFVGASSGVFAEAFGWPTFFALTIAAAAPALVLLRFLPRSLESVDLAEGEDEIGTERPAAKQVAS